MTRINAGIPVEELHSKHLLAEHYEIVRIPNNIKRGKFNLLNQPTTFTLGTGHVKFFYDKLLFLEKRYNQIYNECLKRGFRVSYFGLSFEDTPKNLRNDYQPTQECISALRKRIEERKTNFK